jgi:hypothetical protein
MVTLNEPSLRRFIRVLLVSQSLNSPASATLLAPLVAWEGSSKVTLQNGLVLRKRFFIGQSLLTGV